VRFVLLWPFWTSLTPLLLRSANTWDSFRCAYNESDVTATIDAVTKLGLARFGYSYFNLDDCWAASRSASGVVQPDPAKASFLGGLFFSLSWLTGGGQFPRGMAYLALYAHQNGLKFGLYTDRGNKTCAGRPGTLGYETLDARTYAGWGVDYLKGATFLVCLFFF
jgi:alpha-galactosidase